MRNDRESVFFKTKRNTTTTNKRNMQNKREQQKNRKDKEPAKE